jgi:(1->4)-alpha-D-glucan 1-alpha-D-glucosylmutase
MEAWSTYRVQLNPGFGFAEAAAIADFVAELGATHLYCSPYLQAAPKSTHGYDVVDPQHLNHELGGAAGFAVLVGALRRAGLGQILDIVPNHMATHPSNRWWWDVLENGPASAYAGFFDIDWKGRDERSAYRVLVPILADHYGRVLDAGDIRIERRGGDFVVRYHEHLLPVSPRTLDELLAAAARRSGSPELADLTDAATALPPARMTDADAVRERHERKVALAQAIEGLTASDRAAAAALDEELDAVNADVDRLDALLRRQNYRLAFWRVAREELDYRRFFNISTLVGVAVEEPDVFAATHCLVLELVRDGTVDGLRVDHIDGLRDPGGYLTALADTTKGVYTVVEKIFGPGEPLPPEWPVRGTSGYDFLTRVNNLFVASEHEHTMTDAYSSFSGETATFADVVLSAKHEVMRRELVSEVDRVTDLLAEVCGRDRCHVDRTRRELRHALREFVARIPVYRLYTGPRHAPTADERRYVSRAAASASSDRPDIDPLLLAFIGELALGEHIGADEMDLTVRLQQLTVSVAAMGVEDTAFYRYHRLISLNEVGGDPGTFGAPPASFHAQTAVMAARWPSSMLTLSTHDTKRSADVRARLNALSELPDQWRRASERWADRNERHRSDGWPDSNTEYLLYQTLVGAWPIDVERMVAFAAKATKEAKVHTSWVDPVTDYDEAVERFVRSILVDPSFVRDLEQFLADVRLVERGHRNSLVQTGLLLTAPGVADIYQGTETWDHSLVDPDNRRPVDYEQGRRLLAGVRSDTHATAWTPVPSTASKLFLVHRLLTDRCRLSEAYGSATYEPLDVDGADAGRVIAFSRGDVAMVGLCRTSIGDGAVTHVEIPSGPWSNVLTGECMESGRTSLATLLGPFPVVVLSRPAP